jgi:hypothetical protein
MSTPWTFTPSGGSAKNLIVLADGVPRKATPEVSVRHIPGGYTSYVDLGGATLPEIDVSARFDVAADALAFEQLQGQAGTLVGAVADIGGTGGSVPVVLADVQRTSRGLTTQGPIVLALRFLITGAAS